MRRDGRGRGRKCKGHCSQPELRTACVTRRNRQDRRSRAAGASEAPAGTMQAAQAVQTGRSQGSAAGLGSRAHLWPDFSCVARKEGQEALLPGVNDIDLVQRHNVHHLAGGGGVRLRFRLGVRGGWADRGGGGQWRKASRERKPPLCK